MIKKIIEHKTRNGILALLGGLLVAVTALYIDIIRGDTSYSIGLYQIVGALTGYIISGAGGVLVMKEKEVRKTLQTIFFYVGAIIVAISMFANYLNVTGPSGFDIFQIVGLGVGLVILACGVFILPQRLFKTN